MDVYDLVMYNNDSSFERNICTGSRSTDSTSVSSRSSEHCRVDFEDKIRISAYPVNNKAIRLQISPIYNSSEKVAFMKEDQIDVLVKVNEWMHKKIMSIKLSLDKS